LLYAAALGKNPFNDAFGDGIVDLKRPFRTGKAKTARPGTLAPAAKALQHPNRRIVSGLDRARKSFAHVPRASINEACFTFMY
jgi:hypothetical protein